MRRAASVCAVCAVWLGAADATAGAAPTGTYCCTGGTSMLPAYGAAGGCGKDSAKVGIKAMSITFDDKHEKFDINITSVASGGNTTTTTKCPDEAYSFNATTNEVVLDKTKKNDCLVEFETTNHVEPKVTAQGNSLDFKFGDGSIISLGHCSGPAPVNRTGGTGGKSPVMGAVGIAVAAVGFGSNFVVIKKKEWDPKDGIFFQFNMVIGVFLMGMLYTYAVRGAPPLQPVAMLGGAMWACGNAATPFIIQSIGMGLGLSIWGSANMLTGWSSAHFGILGVAQETVPHQLLNVAGALVAVLAILIYAQVKNKEAQEPAQEAALLPPKDDGAPSSNKAIGVAVAIIAGILFGACFNPCQYAIDKAAKNHCNKIMTQHECMSVHFDSDDRTYCSWDGTADPGKMCGGMPGPDLAFSQFCGILFASFTIMAVYGGYQQFIVGSGPIFINVPLVVPAFVSGAIWACAQIGWFVASDNLSMVVSFPIITTIPAIIGNLWGYFAFDELATDTKNVTTLMLGELPTLFLLFTVTSNRSWGALVAAGICCSITAGVLIALSKIP